MPVTSTITLPGKPLQMKTFSVTRTMTAGTDRAFVLPKNARIVSFAISGTASNAGTTATLSVGTTSGTPTEFVNAVGVTSGGIGNGFNMLAGVAGAVGAKLTSDTIVYVKYAETGTASSAGAWQLYVFYVLDSSNQTGVFQ